MDNYKSKSTIQNILHDYQYNALIINCLPILLGIVAFFLVVGPEPLKVQNIAWLKGGDPGQSYLGWSFFRQSPWSFPLGSNPAYGLELSSSIFYSDSIPLLAFLFKPFSSILPTTFQYFGLWYLVCFVLQAWFAWQLMGLITKDVAVRIIATAFFLFSPTMLWLIHGQHALFGHWLILAAFYLCLATDIHRRQSAWIIIVIISSLIHAYLFAMILALWISDLARRLIVKDFTYFSVVREVFLIFAGVIFALWQAGFFLIKTGFGSAGDFGYWRLNILSPVNPGAAGPAGFGLETLGSLDNDIWSYILPALPYRDGSNDLVFLGIGVLILIVLTTPYAVRRIRHLKFGPMWIPLSVVLLSLTVFALSNNVAVGKFEINLPIPSAVLNVAQMFRCSVRMFWPMYYFIYLGALYLLIKRYKRNMALVILSCLLALQAADTSAGWLPIRHSHTVNASTWHTPFKSSFWEAAGKRYRNIRVVYPGRVSKYEDIAYLSAALGMATDAAYLARYDSSRDNNAVLHAIASVRDGQYDDDSVYIIFDPVAASFAVSSIRATDDLISCIDGFVVIAPGWKHCSDCPQLSPLNSVYTCNET